MIQYEEIHHVALLVKDVQKSKEFYEGILGFKMIKRPNFNFPGEWYAVNQTQQIHLIEESALTVDQRKLITRNGHFALRITNFFETAEYLKAAGLEPKVNPDSITGFGQIFCKDPDGNLIELNTDQKDL